MKFSAGAAPSRKIVFIAAAAFLQSKISKSKGGKTGRLRLLLILLTRYGS